MGANRGTEKNMMVHAMMFASLLVTGFLWRAAAPSELKCSHSGSYVHVKSGRKQCVSEDVQTSRMGEHRGAGK